MKALISPNENNRVCQVEAQDFPVAEPLYWVDCPDTITTEWTYDGTTFVAPVIPEPVVVPAPTKEELLAQLLTLQAQIESL